MHDEALLSVLSAPYFRFLIIEPRTVIPFEGVKSELG